MRNLPIITCLRAVLGLALISSFAPECKGQVQNTSKFRIERFAIVPLSVGRDSAQFDRPIPPLTFELDQDLHLYIPDPVKERVVVYNKSTPMYSFKVEGVVDRISADPLSATFLVHCKFPERLAIYSDMGRRRDDLVPPDGQIFDMYCDHDEWRILEYEKWNNGVTRNGIVSRRISRTLGQWKEVKSFIGFQSPQVDRGWSSSKFSVELGQNYWVLTDAGLVCLGDTSVTSELRWRNGQPFTSGESGLLFFDGKREIISDDWPLSLSVFDMERGKLADTNLVSFLQQDLVGTFARDFFYSQDGAGYLTFLLYRKGSVYLMGSTRKETIIYRIACP